MSDNKVYLAIVNTYYECGDESDHSSVNIGIFTEPQKAYDACNEYLKKIL